jgi:hypothetical protein
MGQREEWRGEVRSGLIHIFQYQNFIRVSVRDRVRECRVVQLSWGGN